MYKRLKTPPLPMPPPRRVRLRAKEAAERGKAETLAGATLPVVASIPRHMKESVTSSKRVLVDAVRTVGLSAGS